MDVLAHVCEVCEQPIPEGESIIDTEEGTAFCAPCAASLLAGERDDLKRRLAAAAKLAKAVEEAIAALEGASNQRLPRTAYEARVHLREALNTYGGQ